MHFWIQHNEISKTHLCWFLPQKKSFYLQASVINSLQQWMKKWTTTLQVKVKDNQIMSDPIRIRRGIYQGDSLSLLRFCLALNTLSYLLKRTNHSFGINSNNQEIRLNHLLHMDDIKLYPATNNRLQGLLQLTQTFSRDSKMSFWIEKCKTLSI
jgi:hypothetical protein